MRSGQPILDARAAPWSPIRTRRAITNSATLRPASTRSRDPSRRLRRRNRHGRLQRRIGRESAHAGRSRRARRTGQSTPTTTRSSGSRSRRETKRRTTTSARFVVEQTPPPPPPPPPPLPPLPLERPSPYLEPPSAIVLNGPGTYPGDVIGYGGGGGGVAVAYTWHLSVVNAGQPRQERASDTSSAWMQGAYFEAVGWSQTRMDAGQWILADREGNAAQTYTFGIDDAMPVTGDWNGDGTTKIGVFAGGTWFFDLDGNGRWDEQDPLGRSGNGRAIARSSAIGTATARATSASSVRHGPATAAPSTARTRIARRPQSPERSAHRALQEHPARPATGHHRLSHPEADRRRQVPQGPDRPRVPIRLRGGPARGRRLERRRREQHRRLPRRLLVPRRRRRRALEPRRRLRGIRPDRATCPWSAIGPATVRRSWACTATARGISTPTATACSMPATRCFASARPAICRSSATGMATASTEIGVYRPGKPVPQPRQAAAPPQAAPSAEAEGQAGEEAAEVAGAAAAPAR